MSNVKIKRNKTVLSKVLSQPKANQIEKVIFKRNELEKYFSELGIENSYLFQPGYETTRCIEVTEDKSFDFNMFKTALDSIAEMLNNWRKNPTLAEAQYLREVLILLRNIDDEFGYNTNYVLPMREYIKNKISFMNSNN